MARKSWNCQRGVRLSITYKTVEGDTFESVSRKNYGTERDADLIKKGNPGLGEPFNVGTEIFIPTSFSFSEPFKIKRTAGDNNEIALFVGGKRFRFWEKIKIKRSIDSISTISFLAPIEAIDGFRDIFKPFTYRDASVEIGGELVFRGTMISVIPIVAMNKKKLQVSCYSRPGVIGDCPPPVSLFPLEFNGQNLNDIARTLCAPFGIGIDFLNDPGPAFERVAVDPTKKVLSFLAELARQRNLIISNTSDGFLLFQQSVSTGKPVARLEQGKSPLISVVPDFDAQRYYSHVTGLSSVEEGEDGAQYTVKNKHLNSVLRPFTFKASDTSDADLKAAVESKVGRMFGNMAAYAIGVSTLREPGGFLWQPNTTLTLLAPDAFVNKEYEFIIRDVEFEKDDDSESAILKLVLPGAFSGEMPETLPWD